MATIAQEIAQLQLNTNNLATTLQEKGVPCNASDGLGSLVTKVSEIPEATASDRIAYQVATIEERDAIADAQTGDLCLVAGQTTSNSSTIEYNWLGNTIYIPKHIELTDEEWELFEEYGSIQNTWIRISDSATASYMYVSPRIYSPDYGSNCLIYIYDRIDYYENGGTNKTAQIRFYNNTDGTYDFQTKSIPTGVHFTVEEDEEGFTITFDREMKCYLNNADYNRLFNLFITGGASVASSFDGIFEYDGTSWNYANLNLSATAADVSAGVDFYSNNGLGTGVFLAEETILNDSKYTEDLLKQIDTSNMTTFNNYLTSCSSRPLVALMDFSNALDCTGCFKSNTDTSLYPDLILPKATILKEFLRQNTGLTTINKIDAPAATNGSYMFYGCSALTNIKDINMPELIDGSYMFYQTALTQEMVQKMNSTKLENASYMYGYNTGITSMSITNEVANCAATLKNASSALRSMTNLSTLTISDLTFNELTTADYLCYGLSKRATINLTNLTLPKLTKLDYAFSSPSNGITVNFTNVNAPELTSMTRLLTNCNTYATLNFTNCSWPKLSGTNAYIGAGFTSNDSSYTSSLDMNLSGFDFSGTTDASNMFNGWYAGTVTMSDKDLSHITTAPNMFYSGVTSISSSSRRRSSRNVTMRNVNFSGLTSVDNFFGAGFYKWVDLAGCDFSNVDTFTNFIVQTESAINSSSTGEFIFKNIKLKPGADTTGFFVGGKSYLMDLTGWTDPAQIKPLAANCGGGTLKIPDVDWTGWTDMSNFFSGGTITGNWDNLEGVTNYHRAFYNVSNAKAIAPYLSFDSATDCGEMFYEINDTGTLDLSDKNMDNVTDMSQMFRRCSLQTVILPDNLPKVETIYNMFEYQPNKNTELIMPKYMPSLKNASYFCYGSSKIPKVTMPEVSQITNLNSAFSSCSALTQVVNLDTSECTDFSGLFYNCTSLENAPTLDTRKATKIGSLFNGCSKLKKAPIIYLSNATSAYAVFKNCIALEEITFMGDPSKIGAGESFADCFSGMSETGTFYYDDRYDYSFMTRLLPSGWVLKSVWEIANPSTATLVVEDAIGDAEATLATYTITGPATNIKTGETLDEITLSGKYYIPLTPKTSETDVIQHTETKTIAGVELTATYTQGVHTTQGYWVDLSAGQWEYAPSISNPNSTVYDGVYRSVNPGTEANIKLTIPIKIWGYTNFTIYIRSWCEARYDFVSACEIDVHPDSTSTYKANGNNASGTAIGNYTYVYYSGLDGGEHTIYVVYRKDGATSSNDDKGYLLIKKP